MTDADDLLLALYDEQMRGASPQQPEGVVFEDDGPLLRAVGGFRGFVFAPRDIELRGTEVDRLIERQRDYFTDRGETVEWRIHDHDRPEDLAVRLRAAGFVPEEGKTVLVGLSSELAAEPALTEGVVVRSVTEDRDMRRIAELEAAVWDMDLGWLADQLTWRAAASPEADVLIAEADGEAVCCGWTYFRPGADFAGLRGGTTLPAWRGRGIYRSLVAARARLAAGRGVKYLQVDATADSLPILSRLGFRAVTTMTPYVWAPPGR